MLAITVVGVACEIRPTLTPVKACRITARPTAAGLKMFCPKPPNNNFASTIANTVAIITA